MFNHPSEYSSIPISTSYNNNYLQQQSIVGNTLNQSPYIPNVASPYLSYNNVPQITQSPMTSRPSSARYVPRDVPVNQLPLGAIPTTSTVVESNPPVYGGSMSARVARPQSAYA